MPHEGAKTHNIPFADFIDEFTTETLTWMDHVPGLRPQVETCSVCDVTWDAIVKLESWAEDFEVSFSMFEQDRFFSFRNHKYLRNSLYREIFAHGEV